MHVYINILWRGTASSYCGVQIYLLHASPALCTGFHPGLRVTCIFLVAFQCVSEVILVCVDRPWWHLMWTWLRDSYSPIRVEMSFLTSCGNGEINSWSKLYILVISWRSNCPQM